MIDNKKRFFIEEYGTKSTFSNFLPGVSGAKGIPLWCHYVNRGQCITCFGIQDKDHSIMEFYPAHQAYRNTKLQGFRTFIKVDGVIVEAFADETNHQVMYIGMNELVIEEENLKAGLHIQVTYYTLPGEEVGALVRQLKITNKDNVSKKIELIDGMPALIPYGVGLGAMKEMGQTTKAWMEVLDYETHVPYFQVRVGMEDSAVVKKITGGNFAFAYETTGNTLPVIVNTEHVFGYDTSLLNPLAFEHQSVEAILSGPQITKNDEPSCFFGKTMELAANESYVINEVYGQTEKKEILLALVKKAGIPGYFDDKYSAATSLTETITDKIATKTASEVFDLYCRQSYLDNVLRGGFPILLGKDKLFYLYSRKHGDMERDYNFFKMLPEFYSQGNGNFRDVNQNRRCDVQFAPFVADANIKIFYNCIQMDGYNPLAVEKITYFVAKEKVSALGALVVAKEKDSFEAFLMESFTPGSLYLKLQGSTPAGDKNIDEIFEMVMEQATGENKTEFGEGYWSDHWTYNLDLIEIYLSIYPDKEHDLIAGERDYTYLTSKATILPRAKRYRKTENGIRQYKFLDKKDTIENVYMVDQAGTVVKSNLLEKLILLGTVKFGALDAYGYGVEMEGGKPGWYDALNGLPGILGSSMCETYELARTVAYTLEMLKKYEETIMLTEELADYMDQIMKAIQENHAEFDTEGAMMGYWNQVNDSKEAYWKKTQYKVSGNIKTFTSKDIIPVFEAFLSILNRGIEKAVDIGHGIAPAYFYFEVTDYTEDADGIQIKDVRLQELPYFLEGPVRFLKLDVPMEEKRDLYEKIRSSELFDQKLNMYKVNAPLADATFELGRCRAFTPGWLENESIWLHMEYKYLLELLKSGLYEEFIRDFHLAAVPFQKEETYGRSLLENSSFIASSANPNPSIHGKGFVARLSGSTVEMIHMWQIMMFGERPFAVRKSELSLEFAPMLPSYLIREDKTVESVFLGEIPVVYHMDAVKDYIPGEYKIERCELTLEDGVHSVDGGVITGSMAAQVRLLQAKKIELFLK